MVPTPCRVRRKLSFERADSQKTLAMGSSTESLGSVEKKAVRLNREKTVDKLSKDTVHNFYGFDRENTRYKSV